MHGPYWNKLFLLILFNKAESGQIEKPSAARSAVTDNAQQPKPEDQKEEAKSEAKPIDEKARACVQH